MLHLKGVYPENKTFNINTHTHAAHTHTHTHTESNHHIPNKVSETFCFSVIVLFSTRGHLESIKEGFKTFQNRKAKTNMEV